MTFAVWLMRLSSTESYEVFGPFLSFAKGGGRIHMYIGNGFHRPLAMVSPFIYEEPQQTSTLKLNHFSLLSPSMQLKIR